MNVFNFNEVQFIVFFSMDHAFSMVSLCLTQSDKWFFSRVLFQKFYSLALTFRSMSHVKLLLYKVWGKDLSWYACSVVSEPSLKDSAFQNWIALVPLSKNQWIILYKCLSFENKKCTSSNFVLSQLVLTLPGRVLRFFC